MLNLVSEYLSTATPVPLALSAASPAARRAVEGSTSGYVVKGLRLHFEEFRKDEEVSCHRRPTRTVCIHAETIPETFYKALWWIQEDGPEVPVAFRAARLTGALHYGAPATTPVCADPTCNVISLQNAGVADLVKRTVSLFLGGCRLRELRLNPVAVAQLERVDVSNCRCLKALQWTEMEGQEGDASESLAHAQMQLHNLRIFKASFSGLTRFPAATFAEWAPAITTALLSGCRALTQEQVNGLLEDCADLRVARLDSTKLSCIDAIAPTCPFLSELNVSNCADLVDVSALSELALLRVLDLHGNAGLTSLDGVGHCRLLRRLDISHCKRLTTLQPLANALVSLKYFNASHCTGLTDSPLHVLRVSPLLEEVKVNQCASVQDFDALDKHANLLVLEAADTGLTSVEALRSCTALEQLNVAGCGGLKEVTALRGLVHLASLDACYTGVTRVAELVDFCPSLRIVLMRECELDAESTTKLEACATRIASTHRNVNTRNTTAAVAMSA